MEAGFGGPWVMRQAEVLAAQIFAGIGVGIGWYHDRRHCKVPPEGFLVILLSTGAPDLQFPGALAYSQLADGVHIEVFYNRVAQMVEPKCVPTLLAHVLAHEIGHMLEGVSRHSDEGIMKAHWDERDFSKMSYQLLSFAPQDVGLIQSGIVKRQMAGLAPGPNQ